MFTGSRPENGSSRMTSSGCAMTVEMNWIFCDIPFESAFDLLRLPVSEPESSEPVVDRGARRPPGQPLQRGVVEEQPLDGHLLVEAPLFRQVADAVIGRARPAFAEDFDRASVREDDVQDHPDGRRLAGTVRADEAVDRSGRNDEIEMGRPRCEARRSW